MNLTSSHYDLLTSVAQILIIFFSGYEYMVNESRDGWKRVTKVGYSIILFCLISGYGSFEKFQASAQEKKQDSLQNEANRRNDLNNYVGKVQSALKDQGKQIVVDKVTNTLKIVDTVRINDAEMPVLDILIDSTMIGGSTPDNIYFKTSFVTLNSKIAFNINPYILMFYIKDNHIFMQSPTQPVGDISIKSYSLKIPYTKFYISLRDAVNNGATEVTDTTYFFVKVDYSNKETGGKKMPTVRRLFLLPPFKISSDPNLLKLQFVGDQGIYKRLSKLLKEDKYW